MTKMSKSYKVVVYDIVWNDTNYQNNWFEIDGYENENIDIDAILDQQEQDCNEDEDRDDLRIKTYEHKIELSK
jgi:hypothetical protein